MIVTPLNFIVHFGTESLVRIAVIVNEVIINDHFELPSISLFMEVGGHEISQIDSYDETENGSMRIEQWTDTSFDH